MPKSFNEQLAQEAITPLHQELLNYVKKFISPARARMSNYYCSWDKAWTTYTSKAAPTKEDQVAAAQGLPTKVPIPLTKAQVNTFVAFAFMLLRQKDDFYEFEGVSDMDKKWSACATKLLTKDFNSSSGVQNLWQTLHNLAIFGIAVQKDAWAVEKVKVPTTHNDPNSVAAEPITTWADAVAYEGNRFETISPYNFFPDPGFPLARWTKGTFVAHETETAKSDLEAINGSVVHGVEHVKKLVATQSSDSWNRFKIRSSVLDWTKPDATENVFTITECYFRNFVPSSIKDSEGNSVGPETFGIPYVIWIANDSRIIRCEPANYLHRQFPYSVAMFNPDEQEGTSLGSLASDIDALQDLISWFLNSRVAAVSRTIDNRFIVDPTMIDTKSIEDNSRLILLRRVAARTDVRRAISQIPQTDVTTGHVGDAQNLIGLMQMVTGVNDAAMGQFNSGRRSAQEARSVVQGAAARSKVIIDLAWNMMFVPQGNRALCNHRQSLSKETFVKINGEESEPLYDLFHADAETLVSSYDTLMYDGSLPSEKGFLAQSMQELLGLLLSNPEAASTFNLDPHKLLEQIYSLRGVGSLTQFKFDTPPVPPALPPVPGDPNMLPPTLPPA